ncbi:MAG: biotin transporter BioY, partial [Planctomycetota bacterium]
IPAAFLSGFAGGGVLASLAVMTSAHALILIVGATWLAAHIGWRGAFAHGVTPFLFGALIKSVVAAACVEHFAGRRRR